MSLRIFARWAAALALALVFAAPAARAEVYDVPILVSTEEEILDLYENGDISEDERDLLIDLLQNKIDLNRADRDALFELPGTTYQIADAIIAARQARGGWFTSVAVLEDVIGLPSDVLAQIRPFLYVVSRTPPPPPVGGSVRIKMAEAFGDDPGPAAYTRLRLDGWDNQVGFGYVGILHEEPGQLSAVRPAGEDPYFIASSPEYTFEYAAKVYLFLDTELWGKARGGFIIGSYTAGFGERLVLDTTNRRRPNGWYSDDVVYESVDSRSADFQPRKGLFGAAAEISHIELSDEAWLDVTALFSWWRHDQYMYDYQPNRTYVSEAAAEDGEDSCYKEGRCFAYETFPNVYDELLIGGNTTVHIGGRAQVGVTGYWARTHFQVGDDFVRWAPSAAFPNEREFWAIGGDVHWGMDIVDLFGEYARTGSGGNGATLRSVLDLDVADLEVTLRYYDKYYDNPHGRGQAAPDEFLGRRARDEVGGRARVVAKLLRWWRVQSYVDFWQRPTLERVDMDALLRTDFDPIRELRISTWAKYADKDLSEGGRDQDYGASTEIDFDSGFDVTNPDQSAIDAASAADDFAHGMKVDWGVQAIVRAIPLTSITAYFKMAWVDASAYDDDFQKSYNTWLKVAVRPLPFLGFQTRIKLFDEDLDAPEEDTDGDGTPDKERGEEYFEWYARVDFRILQWVSGYVRYDLRKFIDVSPPDRNPEHVIRGVVDVKF